MAKTLRRMLGYLAPYKTRFILGQAAMLVGTAAGLAFPWAVRIQRLVVSYASASHRSGVARQAQGPPVWFEHSLWTPQCALTVGQRRS